MAYSRDASIRDQEETREKQDQIETSVRLERDYRDMEDGLSQSNKIAGERQRDMEIWRMAYHSLTRQLERARDQRESQRGDMELFRQLVYKQTDRQIDKRTDITSS